MQIKIPMNFVLNKGNGLDIMKTSHMGPGGHGRANCIFKILVMKVLLQLLMLSCDTVSKMVVLPISLGRHSCLQRLHSFTF